MTYQCDFYSENLEKKVTTKKKAIFQLRGWSVLSFFISKLIPEKLGGAAHQMCWFTANKHENIGEILTHHISKSNDAIQLPSK